MQYITCHRGQIQKLSSLERDSRAGGTFVTGLAALDELAPGKAFARAAVHELLWREEDGRPLFFAAMLARSAAERGAIIWSDPDRMLYPPALAAMGIDLSRLYLLRTKDQAEELWAIAECLRCRGVSATVASLGRLSQVEARRMQLAAERGGGAGILLRPDGKASAQYAAATRWRIRPAAGERTVQRWNIQLVHGHGGRTGESVILEACRETHRVRADAELADRPLQAAAESRPVRIPA